MSYKVNPATSYGRMRRYVAQVIGGLESREATRDRRRLGVTELGPELERLA